MNMWQKYEKEWFIFNKIFNCLQIFVINVPTVHKQRHHIVSLYIYENPV